MGIDSSEISNAYEAEHSKANISFTEVMLARGRFPDPPLPWKLDQSMADFMAKDLQKDPSLKDADHYLKSLPDSRKDHFVDLVNRNLQKNNSDLWLSMKCTADGYLLELADKNKKIDSHEIERK